MDLLLSSTLEVPEPSQWPLAMGRFGTTSTRKNKFRVVYAPTVKKLIFGTNAKGETGAHVRPAYRHLGAVWIMEKWLSGEQATGMSPRQYEQFGPRDPESGMLLEGPYPHQGVYHHCWTFDADTLQGGMAGAVEKIVGMIEQGEKRSASEIKARNKEMDEKAEKEAAHQRFLRVRETEPLNGIRPMSFPGATKTANHKTVRTPVSANELQRKFGAPTKRGSVVSMRGKKVQINGV